MCVVCVMCVCVCERERKWNREALVQRLSSLQPLTFKEKKLISSLHPHIHTHTYTQTHSLTYLQKHKLKNKWKNNGQKINYPDILDIYFDLLYLKFTFSRLDNQTEMSDLKKSRRRVASRRVALLNVDDHLYGIYVWGVKVQFCFAGGEKSFDDH